METQGSWQRSLWDFIQFGLGILGFFIAVAGIVVSSLPAMITGFILAAIAIIYFNLKDD